MAAMTTGRAVRACWLGVAMGAVLGAGAARADGVAPADVSRWVSADAVVYLEVVKPADLVDRLTDDRVQKPIRTVPSIRSALEGAEFRHLKEVAGSLAGRLGTTWEQALRGLTGGGVVVAVEVSPGQPPRVFLVATPTDPDLLRRANAALTDLARKDAAEKGKPDPVKEIAYRGATGYVVGPNVVYGIVKDRLVVADRPETAKAVVDRALDGPGSSGSVADGGDWKARKAAVRPDTTAWGLARLDRLRKIDPDRFGPSKKTDVGQTVLFGGWVEAVRKAPTVGASLTWTERTLAAEVALPVPEGGRGEAFRGFVPPKGSGAPSPANPPGTVASLGLWRDLSAIWEARADLLPPEAVQNLTQLDGVAGQFFGGRDFGSGVLGALTSDWRLVVALQDYQAMSPSPDVKLPAFALVADLKPDDEEFAQRLKVAFQTFVGLANIGAAQSKSPPLELGSESFEGVTISTTHYMTPKPAAADKDKTAKESVPTLHNFSPSVAQVGNHFILGSSLGLTRDLVRAMKSPGQPGDATLVAEADGAAAARLVDLNRNRLVMQNMLEKGHDKDQAESEVGLLAALLRYLGRGRLSIHDDPAATRARLEFTLGK